MSFQQKLTLLTFIYLTLALRQNYVDVYAILFYMINICCN